VTDALPPADERAWAAYRELRLLLDARIAQDLEGTGLSLPDVDVLAAVRGGGASRTASGWPRWPTGCAGRAAGCRASWAAWSGAG
jgi:hypothetical protein